MKMPCGRTSAKSFTKLTMLTNATNFHGSPARTFCKARMFCERMDSSLQVVTFNCIYHLVLFQRKVTVCTASFHFTLIFHVHLHFFLLVVNVILANAIPILLSILYKKFKVRAYRRVCKSIDLGNF